MPCALVSLADTPNQSIRVYKLQQTNVASLCLFLLVPFQFFEARDINGAREELLNIFQRNIDNNIIYFDGWSRFGAAAVLKSIAQAVPAMKAPPPELQFGRTIYVDCSTWISKRVMQRRIAEELKLDHETMALFDKQDEEDDFHGVDQGSRDVIRKVSAIIHQTLIESRFLMLFLNGSDEEVFLSRFGIPEYNCIVIWSFTRWLFTIQNYANKKEDKIRHTSLFICNYHPYLLRSSQISALFREETDSIVARHPCMSDIDPTLVTVCCLYRLLMQYIFQSNTLFAWTSAHAPNYWMCDGIIQGSRAREISNALHKEISFSERCEAEEFEMVCGNLMEDPSTPFVLVTDGNMPLRNGSPRWVSITLKYKKLQEDTKTLLARASSVFIQLKGNYWSSGLPNGLFQGCNNLAVLTLSCCAFSFAWPPFLHCNKLRFLGLDHCTNLDKAKLEELSSSTKWTCLHSLYVLDLRYTCWEEILSEENVDLMANIMELNIEGVRDWQYINKLQKRLPCLQRLRIIKPPRQANKTSIDMNESFRDKAKLEILDLSGNSDMENLPTSLSMANKLEVLVLDGCCGLENVLLTNSSLRSFSFDAYGASSQWTSASELLPPESFRPQRPSADVDKKDVKTFKISLEGCTQLENLFLRGLPNLVELDLSGCAIKVLDLRTRVMDVPNLKRLFLLGCEHFRSIRCGSYVETKKLELLCIDTRPWPGRALRPSIVQHKTFRLQVHIITADARLARSLHGLTSEWESNYYFNISITSSSVSTGVAQPTEANSGKVVVAALYGDICNEVGLMWDFPQPPTSQFDCHIEIGDGSCNVESELQLHRDRLGFLMRRFVQSLHVHDASFRDPAMPATSAL
ncbi:hypothetical protein CFC21_086702 [Triticum aestivum]|uniref:NB-ARC domain-containing protein n=2 Tax=Triticum aestivum TaxID=4565 RepID=A0A3B6PIF8_WHEAT|nr:hypothetical protein CFC21_086702 [Triticum aestivum]